MCLILVAHDTHPEYALVVAANRDEFYARPTEPAAFWASNPAVLAGRDLEAGGTWLGFTREGRFAAITNYREGERSDARHSRGQLTLAFLASAQPPGQYLQALQAEADQYRGFNLLLGRPGELHYYGNRAGPPERLDPGVYALSNGTLRDDWTKMRLAKLAFTRLLRGSFGPASLVQMMADELRLEDTQLPDTGVGLALERMLSARFIRDRDYGTRATTVLLVRRDGEARFVEQNFNRQGPEGPLKDFRLNLKIPSG